MQNELLNYLNNKDSENTVLSTIILKPELIDEVFVKPSFFHSKINGLILSSMQNLIKEGYKLDIATLLDYMSQSKEVDTGQLYVRLKELSSDGLTSSNFNYHQNKIIESFKKRQSILILQKAMDKMVEVNPNEVINSLKNEITYLDSITNSDLDNGHIQDIMLKVFENLNTGDENVTSSTGFKSLDHYFKFKRQDYIILGARPSAGKTALAMNLARNHTLEFNKPSVVFSIEMPNEAVGNRLLSSESNVSMNSMRDSKRLTNDDWNKLAMGIGEFSGKKMHMFDKSSVDTDFIRQKATMISKLYPDEHLLIVIDYLQLINGKKGNRLQEISEISRELKRIARDLDATLIALSQLSRGVEQREDKRPMMSDLKESGQIEADADVINLLYRDDYYNRDSEKKNIVEVIVAKNRNGSVGTAMLGFKKELSKFVNIEYTGGN